MRAFSPALVTYPFFSGWVASSKKVRLAMASSRVWPQVSRKDYRPSTGHSARLPACPGAYPEWAMKLRRLYSTPHILLCIPSISPF